MENRSLKHLSLLLLILLLLCLPLAASATLPDQGTCPNDPTGAPHDYSFSSEPANCKHGIIEIYTCKNCGYTEEFEYGDLGEHNWVEEYRAPTCSEEGYRGSYCSVCGEKGQSTTISATGQHIPETIPAVAATCTAGGKTEGSKCSVCGTILTAQQDTAALGHDYDTLSYREPMVNLDGYRYVVCRRCGQSDTIVIPALTHDDQHFYEKTDETPPTCTEWGSRTFTCTVCGDSYTESLWPLEHNYQITASAEPTAAEDGYRVYTCTRCGDSYTETIPKVAHEHNYTLTAETEATCTEAGSKTYTCTVCGDTYSESTPALGHDYDTLYYREPMVNLDGYRYVVCRRCGQSDTIVIPALTHDEQHSYVKTDETPATCTEWGSRTFTCSVCGYSYTESLWPLEHWWDEGVVTKEAGYLEEGEITYTCQRDASHKRTETIPVKKTSGGKKLMGWLRDGGDALLSPDFTIYKYDYPLKGELYQPAEVLTEITADRFRGYWKSVYVDEEGSAHPASTLDDETDLYVEGTSAILGGPVFDDVQVKMDSTGGALTCSTDGAMVLLQLQQDGFLRMTKSLEKEEMIWYMLPVYVRGLDPEADAERDAMIREANVKALVARCYKNALGREGSEDEIASWATMVTEGGRAIEDIVHDILGSVEFQSRNLSNEEIVKILYRIYFDREADEGGFSYWTGLLDGGESLETVEACFAGSEEFKSFMSD
ncbi:MAG: DUF4214 domain-containing protein [Clostridia bacterium]|nr:DUF4214 domain-containing protein [Clostridia bacterium]